VFPTSLRKNLNQPAILKSKEDSNHSRVYVKCHFESIAESGKIETIQEPMAEAFHQEQRIAQSNAHWMQ
jgi:hypothetical protein